MDLRKFVVEVIETKEVEILLDMDKFGEDYLESFNKYITKVEDYAGIAECIALQAARYPNHFIEGLGDWPNSWQREKNIEELGYHVNVTEVDVELEFKEEVQ